MSEIDNLPEWWHSPKHICVLEYFEHPRSEEGMENFRTDRPFIGDQRTHASVKNIIQNLLKEGSLAPATLEEKIACYNTYTKLLPLRKKLDLPPSGSLVELAKNLALYDRENQEAIYCDKLVYHTTEYGKNLVKEFHEQRYATAVSLRKTVFDYLITLDYESAAEAVVDFDLEWKITWEEGPPYEVRILQELQEIRSILNDRPYRGFNKYPQELIRKINIIIYIGNLYWNPIEKREILWNLIADEPGFDQKEVEKHLWGFRNDTGFKFNPESDRYSKTPVPEHLSYNKTQRKVLPTIDYQILIDTIGVEEDKDLQITIIPLNDYNVERIFRGIRFLTENDAIFSDNFRLAKLDMVRGEFIQVYYGEGYEDKRNWVTPLMDDWDWYPNSLIEKGPDLEYPFISIPIYKTGQDLNLTPPIKDVVTQYLDTTVGRFENSATIEKGILVRLKFGIAYKRDFVATLRFDDETVTKIMKLWDLLRNENAQNPGFTQFEFRTNQLFLDRENYKNIQPTWLPNNPDEGHDGNEFVHVQLRNSVGPVSGGKKEQVAPSLAPDWEFVSENSVSTSEDEEFKASDGYIASITFRRNGKVYFSLEEIGSMPLRKFYSVKTWTVEEFVQDFAPPNSVNGKPPELSDSSTDTPPPLTDNNTGTRPQLVQKAEQSSNDLIPESWGVPLIITLLIIMVGSGVLFFVVHGIFWKTVFLIIFGLLLWFFISSKVFTIERKQK